MTAKPTAPTPEYQNIPESLQAMRQFVGWSYEQVDGGWAKVPFTIRDHRVKAQTAPKKAERSTDPDVLARQWADVRKGWSGFEEAVRAYKTGKYSGIGFVFTGDDGLTGVDLDDCVDTNTGEIHPDADALIQQLGGYWEFSPSGTGLKGIGFGKKPGTMCSRLMSWGGKVEIFDQERYFTLTGRVYGEYRDLADIQQPLNDLYFVLWPTESSTTPHLSSRSVPLSDQELLDRMFASKSGPTIRALWTGDASRYNDDESRRDFALMSHLAWWTNGDRQRMETLFDQSECGQRGKWLDRADYRERTIERILQSFSGGYDPERMLPSRSAQSYCTVRGTVSSRTTATETGPTFLRSDTGNAARFVHLFGDRARYDHSRKCWFVWDGQRWREDRCRQVQEWAKRTVLSIYSEAASCTDDNQRSALAAHAKNSDRVNRIAAILTLATSDPVVRVSGDQWDTNPFLLNCQNGTVDLKTGELKSHDSADLLTKICPVDFDPDASAPTWERCLQRWQPNPEVRDFLRRSAGYMLTGHTGEETAFFIFGDGRNGKSKFIGGIEHILGDYAARIPVEVLLDPRRAGGATPELMRVIGARLVVASEIAEERRLNEAFIKDVTGGDRITARALYGEMMEFRPQFKLVLCGNHKPILQGVDAGIRSRLPLIPWTETIPESERDPYLAAKLEAEGPGILAWAVRGCLEWQKLRLCPPAAVINATREYHAEQDAFGTFLRSECRVDPDDPSLIVDAAALRQAYEKFVEERGDRSRLNPIQVAERLRQVGANNGSKNINGRNRRVWTGIALLSDHEGNTGNAGNGVP